MKTYKIINNSIARGLVSEDGVIKSSKELGAVSLAPNLRSLWMWGIELSTNFLCPVVIPDREDTIYIAEIELPDDMVVDFCEDAYDLENASWKKVTVIETGKAGIDGWQYPKGFLGLGPTEDAPVKYGAYPEIRVKECRVSRLYKIDKKHIEEASDKLPYYLMDQGEPENMKKEIREFKKELDDLKNHMVECELEKAFDHIKNIDVLDKGDIWMENTVPLGWNGRPSIAGFVGKALLWSLGCEVSKENKRYLDISSIPLKSQRDTYFTILNKGYGKVYFREESGYITPRVEIDEESGDVTIHSPFSELEFTENIYELSKLVDVLGLLNTTKDPMAVLRVLVNLMGRIRITLPVRKLDDQVIELIDVPNETWYVDMTALYRRGPILDLSSRTFCYKKDLVGAWRRAIAKRFEEILDVLKNHPYFFDDAVLYKIRTDIEPGDYTDRVKIETWFDEYNGCIEVDYFLDGKSISACEV